MIISVTKWPDGKVVVETDTNHGIVMTMERFRREYLGSLSLPKDSQDDNYTRLYVKKENDRPYSVDMKTFLS